MSATLSFFGLAVAGLSFAQTTTISLYIPGADTQPLIGSIIGSDSAATTYALQCSPGTDASNCGFPGVFTLTEGPATAAYTMSAETGSDGTLAFTGYMDCSLAGTASAVCADSFGGSEANFPGSSTETFSGTDFTFMPVTVTGTAGSGAAVISKSSSSLVTGGAIRTGTASTTTKMSSKASGTETTASKSSGTGTASGTNAGSQSTSSSTGGMSAITGNMRLVVGGAALAMAVLA